MLASAVVHAAAAVTIGGVLAAGGAFTAPAQPTTVEVDVDGLPDTPAVATGQPQRVRPAPRKPPATRGTQAPVKAPSVPAVPVTASPTDDRAPARFALSAGTVATGPSPSLASLAPRSGAPSDQSTAVAEGQVDVPARLMAAGPLSYPLAAREAELELDVPLEIVVDAAGHVVSARAVSRAGYGLDEAALRGIRGYRFSPARRAGHPVPVRMGWTVQFRLR